MSENELIRIIPVYDPRARNGVWCTHPYEGHPKGCPNFPKCPNKYPDFKDIAGMYEWYALLEEFDLGKHAAEMLARHPEWSERQCRNVYYWQGAVMARLRKRALKHLPIGGVLLAVPEASGVNVFATMNLAGVTLERHHPNIVRKVMLVGKKRCQT